MDQIEDPVTISGLCPLTDSTSYIRLLKIIRSEGRSLEVELRRFPLTDTQPYHAISYVWGSKDKPHTISVQHTRLTVRENCHKALLQAQTYVEAQTSAEDPDYEGEQYYWIDAICIDQEDPDEKANQVQLMGLIFDKAKKVLSCVGDLGEGSDDLVNLLENAPGDLVGPEWPDRDFIGRAFDWLKRHSAEEIKAARIGLTALLERRYFTRVWILQEVFRKQSRTILCCGDRNVSFKALFALKRAFFYSRHEEGPGGLLNAARNIADIFVTGGRFAAIGPEYNRYDHPSQSSSFLLDVSFLGQRFSNGPRGQTTQDGRDGLEEILDMAAACSCTDVRDRIYGTLQLIDWESRAPIRPDYHKSRFELTLEILRHGWPRGRYETMASVVRLTTIFDLVRDAESDQFGETAHAIIELTRQSKIGSGQTQEGMMVCVRPRWLETVAEYASDSSNGARTTECAADRATMEDLFGTSPPDNQSWTHHLIFHLSSSSDNRLPISQLNLRKRDEVTMNETRVFNLFLVPEDVLIIAFVLISVHQVPVGTIERFLRDLRDENYRFSSYAQAQ